MRAPTFLAACLLLVVAACGGPAAPTGEPAGTAPPSAGTSVPEGPILGQTFGLVYDPALGRIVLVNGAVENAPDRPTELWTWDGTAWEVLDRDGPPARSFGAVGRDPDRGVIVVHGGLTGRATALDETVEWDGRDWTVHEWNGEGPGAREGAGLAWDDAGERMLLFGGAAGFDQRADTWAWDGTEWAEVAADGPTPRFVSLMTDTRFGGILLHGGHWVDGNEGGFLADTWAWDGTEWELVSDEEGPGPRVNSPGAWDANREGVVLFGGGQGQIAELAGDTWLWNGAWTQIETAAATPPRNGHAIAFDEARGVSVLVGGLDRPGGRQTLDVWELGASGWRQAFPEP